MEFQDKKVGDEVKVLTQEGFFIVKRQDLKKADLNVYKICGIDEDFFVDNLSIYQFLNTANSLFMAVPKMLTEKTQMFYDTKPVFALTPVMDTSCKNLTYSIPKEIKGTYGNVKIFPTEKIAIKTSIAKQKDISPDFLKEIVIYRYFEKVGIVPKLLKFILAKNCRLDFEAGCKSLWEVFKEKIDIKSYMFQLINILKIAADNDIMHLDLKPSNCIIMEDGSLKLIDWGLAEIDTTKNKNKIKAFPVQTLWYRSPEVLEEYSTYNHKADIFSVGIIFIELFLKKTFLPGKDETSQKQLLIEKLIEDKKLKKQLQENLINTQSLADEISKKLKKLPLPEEIIGLISGMLEFNPNFRIDYDQILNHMYFADKIPIQVTEKLNCMPIIYRIDTYWFPNHNVREIILRCLSAVAKNFRGTSEILCLAYQICDLYNYKCPGHITSDSIYKYSLISFLIASKILAGFSEINMKWIIEFSTPMDEFEGIRIEREIISALNGNILMPTLYTYWSRENDDESLFKENFSKVINIYSRLDIYSKTLEEVYEENKMELTFN